MGLTTEEITRDGHAFSEPDAWPECISYDLDYYRRSGLFFDSYNEAVLTASFAAQTSSGQRMCAFKFAHDEDLAQARAEIEAGTFLLSSLSSRTTTYSYTISLRLAAHREALLVDTSDVAGTGHGVTKNSRPASASHYQHRSSCTSPSKHGDWAASR